MTLLDGYVSERELLNHPLIKSANFEYSDLIFLDLARREEHSEDQFLRNFSPRRLVKVFALTWYHF